VGLDQPSLEISENCGTSSTLERSENSGNLFPLSSQHATEKSTAFVPSQPKKITTAIDQLVDTISRFQQNLNTEFNKLQNELKNIAIEIHEFK
jgi:gas vesicle protein